MNIVKIGYIVFGLHGALWAVDTPGIAQRVTESIAQRGSVAQAVSTGYHACAGQVTGELVGYSLGAGLLSAGVGYLGDVALARAAAYTDKATQELERVIGIKQIIQTAAKQGGMEQEVAASFADYAGDVIAADKSVQTFADIVKQTEALNEQLGIFQKVESTGTLPADIFSEAKLGDAARALKSWWASGIVKPAGWVRPGALSAVGATSGTMAGLSVIADRKNALDACYDAVNDAAHVTVDKSLYDGPRLGFLAIDNLIGTPLRVRLYWWLQKDPQEFRVLSRGPGERRILWALGPAGLDRIELVSGNAVVTLYYRGIVPINQVIGATVRWAQGTLQVEDVVGLSLT